MILEEETFRFFGYTSWLLSRGSDKKLFAVCDNCGKVRILSKWTYKELCKSCSLKGKHHSEETKQKMSDASRGKNNSFYGKHHTEETKQIIRNANTGENNPRYGRPMSEDHKRKISKSHKGENNPMFGKVGENSANWRGGISFEPYCVKFNNNLKERVREFFDRKCCLCGKDEIENEQRLAVHHVGYDKMVCCSNVKPLFVALCKTCHAKTNFNREEHKNFFTNLITEKYNDKCYYTKEEYRDKLSQKMAKNGGKRRWASEKAGPPRSE